MPYTSFYDNGFPLAKGSLRNGRKEGIWTFYRINGSILATGGFYNDRQHGPWVVFDMYSNPQKIYYINGVIVDPDTGEPIKNFLRNNMLNMASLLSKVKFDM